MAASRGLLLRQLRGLSTAVCRSSPWLMVPSNAVADTFTPDLKIPPMDYSFYRLSDKQTISLQNKAKIHDRYRLIAQDAFYVGSSNGWLLCCNPLDYTIFLTNPLSPSPPFIQLPFLTPPAQNVSDVTIQKFAMSSSPDSCSVIIAAIFQNTPQILRFAKFGKYKSPYRWINLETPSQVPFIEVIYSYKEQLFYTLNSNGVIETWDLRDEENPKLVKAFQPTFNSHDDPKITDIECMSTTKYLVESKGDILLVIRYEDPNISMRSKTRGFDVYRLSYVKESWEQVESLGDRVVFLGMNEPFILSASDFPELKPNSIYFTGPACDEGKYASSDWGIYDLKDETVTCHYPCDYWSKIRPPPIWIGPDNSGKSTWRL